MAIVMNVSGHVQALTVGTISPRETRNVNTAMPIETALIHDGILTVVNSQVDPPAPVTPPGNWKQTSETISDLPASGNFDGDVRLVRAAQTPYVWSALTSTWSPLSAQSGTGGSLPFTQLDGSLTASLPWRAASATHFATATVTVADAVSHDVDLVHVVLNTTTAATLSLTTGQTTATTAVGIDVQSGDRLSVVRLAADGGALLVQLDLAA